MVSPVPLSRPGGGISAPRCGLLRLRRLLAADLDLGLASQRREIAAFVTSGEHGAERDQQGDAANVPARPTRSGFPDRFHEPPQIGAPSSWCAPHPMVDFLTDFRRM